jgi:hypothetical protein
MAKESIHTSCDQEVNTFLQLFSFRSAIGSSHDDTMSLRVLVEQLTGHTPNLKGQLSVILSARFPIPCRHIPAYLVGDKISTPVPFLGLNFKLWSNSIAGIN